MLNFLKRQKQSGRSQAFGEYKMDMEGGTTMMMNKRMILPMPQSVIIGPRSSWQPVGQHRGRAVYLRDSVVGEDDTGITDVTAGHHRVKVIKVSGIQSDPYQYTLLFRSNLQDFTAPSTIPG